MSDALIATLRTKTDDGLALEAANAIEELIKTKDNLAEIVRESIRLGRIPHSWVDTAPENVKSAVEELGELRNIKRRAQQMLNEEDTLGSTAELKWRRAVARYIHDGI